MFRRRRRSKPEAIVDVCPAESQDCEVSCEENECAAEECYPVMHDRCAQNCAARVVSTKTVVECSNEAIALGNKLIARVPVVLAEALIQADVESIIRLEEQALEIKRIQKNVFVEQCKLLLPTNKLFIKGHVRKNIEYATAGCVSGRGISGDIRHTTVNVPFECVTAINFGVMEKDKDGKKSSNKNDGKKNGNQGFLPQFNLNFPGADAEIELLNNCLLGANMNERIFVDFEQFTEKPYCELVFAFITEADIECENIPVCDLPHENTFQTLKEKMVINLLIKVLQNQQVRIPNAEVVVPGETDNEGKDKNDGKNDGKNNNKN